MIMNNIEAVEIIKKLKLFCKDTECGNCCFADDIDGHCMLTDEIPMNLDIKEFKKQAKELL